MGTNYYVLNETCKHCGHTEPDLHVGKNSVGWVFLFSSYPKLGLTSFNAWFKYLKDRKLVTEYYEEVQLSDFVSTVVNKKKESKCRGSYLDKEGYAFSDKEFC